MRTNLALRKNASIASATPQSQSFTPHPFAPDQTGNHQVKGYCFAAHSIMGSDAPIQLQPDQDDDGFVPE